MEINVHEAKSTLSKLLVRVQLGEEVVIAKGGKPVAKLSPIDAGSKPRTLGSAQGRFVTPDDFDAPLPDDILESFGL